MGSQFSAERLRQIHTDCSELFTYFRNKGAVCETQGLRGLFEYITKTSRITSFDNCITITSGYTPTGTKIDVDTMIKDIDKLCQKHNLAFTIYRLNIFEFSGNIWLTEGDYNHYLKYNVILPSRSSAKYLYRSYFHYGGVSPEAKTTLADL